MGVARTLALAAALAAQSLATPAFAQSPPQVGQVSKDSVWVPTPDRMIRRMLQLADVTPSDVVMDLGSGDGRIPIHAAKHFGAGAIGVELEENLVRLSVESARAQGVSHLARFIRQDLYEADLSQATVLALYISPGVMTRLKPRLLELKPGTRVVSHHFTLGDWEPDEVIRTEGRTGYLWVVPADARGSWTVALPGNALRLRIEQAHQSLAIRGERHGRPVNVVGARLRGTEISFTAFDVDGGARRFHGSIEGGRMVGDSEGQEVRPLRWSALRD
ncbi:MAG: SAM-dependent methyltransferase [Betaproteobacteria bacterium]